MAAILRLSLAQALDRATASDCTEVRDFVEALRHVALDEQAAGRADRALILRKLARASARAWFNRPRQPPARQPKETLDG